MMGNICIAEVVHIADPLEMVGGIRKSEGLTDCGENTAYGWLALYGMIEAGANKANRGMN